METFSVGAAFTYGWEKFKTHFLFLWMILGSVWGVSIVFNLLQKGAGKETFLGTLIGLAAIVVGFIVQMGLVRIYLDLADGTKDKLSALFSQYRLFWNYFGATILYGLMVVIGLILFIIPGIYIVLRFQFFSYLIVDKNLGVMDALKKSSVMSDGVKWKLLGFFVAVCGLNILGLLAFVFGLLVTIPMSIMAYVYVYLALRDREVLPVVVPPIVTPEPAPATPVEPVVMVEPVSSEKK